MKILFKIIVQETFKVYSFMIYDVKEGELSVWASLVSNIAGLVATTTVIPISAMLFTLGDYETVEWAVPFLYGVLKVEIILISITGILIPIVTIIPRIVYQLVQVFRTYRYIKRLRKEMLFWHRDDIINYEDDRNSYTERLKGWSPQTIILQHRHIELTPYNTNILSLKNISLKNITRSIKQRIAHFKKIEHAVKDYMEALDVVRAQDKLLQED